MLKILALITIFALSVYAAGDATFEAVKRDLNVPAVIMFFIFSRMACYFILHGRKIKKLR